MFPLWNGNGTVKVAVIDSNRQPATQAIVDAVKLYIETERPVGASVTVESGVLFNVTVSANVDLDGSATMDEVKARIQAAIVDHFKDIAFKTKPYLLSEAVGHHFGCRWRGRSYGTEA